MTVASDGPDLSRLMAKAALIRTAEQRLLDLFAEGKLFGTVHTCIGQEFTGVAVAESLRDGDVIFSNHRCHGHYIARTGDVGGLIAEVMGKTTGICGGRGGSQHLCAPGFFSNGVQGGIAPVSAGIAFQMKRRGDGNVIVCFIGDGTLGEGAVYETFNIVSKWQLPIVFLLEHNGYAQSTNQDQTLAGDICARAEAFGIATHHGTTEDPIALTEIASNAIAAARECAPQFMRVDTYRLMAHSKGDDDRDEAEVNSYWDRDPLNRYLEEHAKESGHIVVDAITAVDAAVTAADGEPYSTAITVDETVQPYETIAWQATTMGSNDRVVNRIHMALEARLSSDEKTVIIGEDIEGPYGGAFKVTKDLSQRFEGRVRNMPISEAAILGMGNGLALAGAHPICEIMFGDFLALTADQWINHAAKFRYMYNEQVEVPLVLRTPMGGKRGYGATHSQSIEKHFIGVPGTHVVAVHHRYDPAELYKNVFDGLDRPTLVVENKLLYGVRISADAPEGFAIEHDGARYPTTRIRPGATPDVTLLCYGGMLPDAEAAVEILFDGYEIACEIVCPTQLYPLNPWPIAESTQRSGRLIVVEEGQNFAAFGAETIATIQEIAPDSLCSVRRIGPPRHAIPSSGPLEKQLLPGADHIVAAVRDMMQA